MPRYIDSVLNLEGQPVAGATVAIFNYPVKTPVGSVTTDDLGLFVIDQPAGRYAIEISGAGITPNRVIDDIWLVDLAPGVPPVAAGDVGRVLVATAPGVFQWGDDLGINPFSDKTDYAADALVTYRGDVYRAPSGIAAGAWDANKWVKLTGGASSGIEPHDPTKSYGANAIVSHDGALWASLGAVAAGPWDGTKWKPAVVVTETGVALYDSTKAYAINQLVAKDGRVYRATTPVAVGGWNAADWQDIAPVTAIASAAEIHAGTNADKAITPAGLRGETIVSPSGTPANDADKIPRLNAAGKLDPAFISSGGGGGGANYLELSGGQMTGPLGLTDQIAHAPGASEAISRAYAEQAFVAKGASSGGMAAQANNKTQTVILDKRTGAIKMAAGPILPAAMAGDRAIGFMLMNSEVTENDLVLVNIGGGTPGAYQCWASNVGAGGCRINVRNVTAAALDETPTVHFAVIPGAVA